MTPSHDSQSWLDEWFPLLLIGFGILFIAILLIYNPTNVGSHAGHLASETLSEGHNQEHGNR